MSFRERWIQFIYESATRSRMQSNPAVIATGCVYLALIVLAIALSFRIDRQFAFPSYPEYPMNLVIAFPLLAVGIGWWIWTVRLFLREKGTPVPLRPPPRLITTGPYEMSRNPMLTGVFFTMFGIGFAAQSTSLVFIFTPVFILLNYLELKGIEEPELEKRFGRAYLDYKKRTPMFFPKRKK